MRVPLETPLTPMTVLLLELQRVRRAVLEERDEIKLEIAEKDRQESSM